LQNVDPKRFDYFLKLIYSNFLWAQIGKSFLSVIKIMFRLFTKVLDITAYAGSVMTHDHV